MLHDVEGKLEAVVDLKFSEDLDQVGFDGLLADRELGSNLLIATPSCNQAAEFTLAGTQQAIEVGRLGGSVVLRQVREFLDKRTHRRTF